MELMNGNAIVQEIKAKLSQIEKRENIRILYACESGSRAWGFESSDYDVRFIFVRPFEDYLRIKELPDFIDAELNEIYDINSWDLKKFFKQVYKSNPVLFEWADSSIVYRTTPDWNCVKTIMKNFVLQAAMIHHYRGMAKSNIRKNFFTSEVVLKKYLYVLHPVLACEWIMQKHSVPPTEFSKLVEEVLPIELRDSVKELLAGKMKFGEKEKGTRIPQLDSFIEAKLNEASSFSVPDEIQKPYEKLDKLFMNIIQQGA